MDKLTALINDVEQACGLNCCLSKGRIHGVGHLRRVAYLAGRFAKVEDVCVKEAVIGGFLHDCARKDDRGGRTHAHESGDLALDIMLEHWPDVDLDKIYSAIYNHADGLTTDDHLTGCIWDADRIALTRLGITPDPKLLSTNVAKRFFTLCVKNNPLLLEIKKTESLIVDKINLYGEFFLGVWWGDAGGWFLEHLLILLEKSLGPSLSKLKIVSLYDYCGLPQMHDQSTCYQLYGVLSRYAHISPEQILCPLHSSATDSVFEKIGYCVFSVEPSFLSDPKNSSLNSSEIFKIDPLSRDIHSRFFERYDNTPRCLKVGPLGRLNKYAQKSILFDNSFRGRFRGAFDYKKRFQMLSGLFSGDATWFNFGFTEDGC